MQPLSLRLSTTSYTPRVVLLLLGFLLSSTAFGQESELPPLQLEDLLALPVFPGNLGPLPVKENSPESASLVPLGKLLFFDARLSPDQSTSCSGCHQPELAWTDGLPTAVGFQGKALLRNTPTILNSGLLESFFWDGRTQSAIEQVKGPLISLNEHGFESEADFDQALAAIPLYVERFKTHFDRAPRLEDAAQAIAAFENTLLTPNARFDRFITGNHAVLTDLEKQGATLFVSKASCTLCHNGPLFSDNARHKVTTVDLAMRTPGLRNVGVTAPYMHDGRFASLDEVVSFYNRGGDNEGELSPLVFPLGLSDDEQEALVAFLHTLTGEIRNVEAPQELDGFMPAMNHPPAPSIDFVPVPPATFASMKELMASGIHEQFSFLGFNIWHTKDMHSKTREMIATSATSMAKLSTQSITLFLPLTTSEEKQTLFTEGMEHLASISKSLAQAARHGTKAEVHNQFQRMEQQCNACHTTFRPDLVWTAHHAE